jgi:hypothetical protein
LTTARWGKNPALEKRKLSPSYRSTSEHGLPDWKRLGRRPLLIIEA